MASTIQVVKDFFLAGTAPATSGNWGGAFFIADRAYQLVTCVETHGTAGSDGGAVTVMLTKAGSGTALSAGTSMLASGISLKGTADTPVTGTNSATPANLNLAVNDKVGMVLTGTPTSVANVCVTVTLLQI